MNNNASLNTYIRGLYSKGFSSLHMSFYKTNLTFIFAPYIGEGNNGLGEFDTKKFLSTSVNFEGAAALYLTAQKILNGELESKEMVLTISRVNGDSLMLERRLFSNNEQSEQMETFFCITKNDVTIPFKFSKQQMRVREGGSVVTKTIESGLGVFAMTLKGYLTGVGAENHLRKLPESFNELDDMMQQPLNGLDVNRYQISYKNYQNTPSQWEF